MIKSFSIHRIGCILVAMLSIASSVAGDIVWSDEFEESTVDGSKWTYDIGNGDWGWGNGELEYYTARSENVYIEDGKLVIQAKRENYEGQQFTSTRMKTKGRMAFTYGRLEARIKIPDLANGLWPAFWLLGDNVSSVGWPKCGEVDILEMGMAEGITGGVQNRRHSAGAFWDYQGNNANYANAVTEAIDLNDDYHIYALDWTPTAMRATIDGVEFWAITIDDPESSLEEFHRPLHIIMNLAVGGQNFVGITDPGAITAPLPAKMYVDWVRLYDDGYTQITTNDDEFAGNFGIFTETTPVEHEIAYGGEDVNLYIWNNMVATTTSAFEGEEAWSFDIGGGTWWGMGVAAVDDFNMKNYTDGILHVQIKTTCQYPIKFGIASSAGGEGWVQLNPGEEEFGLVRDGQWHEVAIPLNRFGGVDFQTVSQLFMVAGDAPAGFNISFDNIYWTESIDRPQPANGNFGLFTENTDHMTAGSFEFGVDGEFYIWENTLIDKTGSPYEGEAVLSFQSTPGLNWFGAAFTPMNVKFDMSAFRYPESRLHFAMKTNSAITFKIGMKSGTVNGIGQKWINFENGNDPYGFVRDGQWHEIDIPMTDIAVDVDLTEVSQFFELLGTDGPISDIAIDDICFTGGGDPLGNDDPNVNRKPSVSISSPSNGSIFAPGSDITIEFNASDSDGSVTQVDIFEGDNLLSTITDGSTTYLWEDVSEGTYQLKARATDDDEATKDSSTITVHIGVPVLTSMTISPGSNSVEVGETVQFSVNGVDQFGSPYPVDVSWSVLGGGSIDSDGLFTASYPGGPFVVMADDGDISAIASVTVTKAGGICTGGPDNGEYTYEVSSDSENPTITFVPGYTGVGNNIVILYYGRNAGAVYPGYVTQPNTPYQINASEGETIYFYYTYSIPEGGEHNTNANRHSVVVGQCGGGGVAGDITGDGEVNLSDVAMLAYYWLQSDCVSENMFCLGADTQMDGTVNLEDWAVIADHWQP